LDSVQLLFELANREKLESHLKDLTLARNSLAVRARRLRGAGSAPIPTVSAALSVAARMRSLSRAVNVRRRGGSTIPVTSGGSMGMDEGILPHLRV
jgi:hypothetical protein